MRRIRGFFSVFFFEEKKSEPLNGGEKGFTLEFFTQNCFYILVEELLCNLAKMEMGRWVNGFFEDLFIQ